MARTTVRRSLEENELKPWRKDMWCIPQVDGEFVARMEDVLDVYVQEPDREQPVVCLTKARPTRRRGSPADQGQAGAVGAL